MDKQGTMEITNSVQIENVDTASDNVGLVAKKANEAAHELTLREAMASYPMAIFWSLMVSMCVIMEGTFPFLFLCWCKHLTCYPQGTTLSFLVTSTLIPSLPKSMASLSTRTVGISSPPPGRLV